jgi:L-lactate dehydrogenase complex protein LldG
MSTSTSRENILRKIRQALEKPVPVPFTANEAYGNVYKPNTEDLDILFAEQFSKLLGKFVYCVSEAEMAMHLTALAKIQQWNNIYCREAELKYLLHSNGFSNFEYPQLNTCDAAITSCEALIARTGSLLMSSGQQSGRSTSVYAPVHICIARTNQLVYDIKDGLQLVQKKYGSNMPSLITLATGPSRTADIEKTLVVGVHGPKEVYLFLLEG